MVSPGVVRPLPRPSSLVTPLWALFPRMQTKDMITVAAERFSGHRVTHPSPTDTHDVNVKTQKRCKDDRFDKNGRFLNS